MASISTFDQNTIYRAFTVAKLLHANVPELLDLKVLCDAANGVQSKFESTEYDLASIAEIGWMVGMTVQEVRDGLYVVTTTVGDVVTANRIPLILPANHITFGG